MRYKNVSDASKGGGAYVSTMWETSAVYNHGGRPPGIKKGVRVNQQCTSNHNP